MNVAFEGEIIKTNESIDYDYMKIRYRKTFYSIRKLHIVVPVCVEWKEEGEDAVSDGNLESLMIIHYIKIKDKDWNVGLMKYNEFSMIKIEDRSVILTETFRIIQPFVIKEIQMSFHREISIEFHSELKDHEIKLYVDEGSVYKIEGNVMGEAEESKTIAQNKPKKEIDGNVLRNSDNSNLKHSKSKTNLKIAAENTKLTSEYSPFGKIIFKIFGVGKNYKIISKNIIFCFKSPLTAV